MFLRITSVVLGTLALTGCASQIGAFFNRPVVQDEVPGAVSTFAQSADRRTVIVALDGDRKGKFCAEPPPDSATGLKTDLQANLEMQGKKLGIGDKLETSVTVMAERTANLDAFRTGVYALCQFNLNGAIDDAGLAQLFGKLIDQFAAVEIATVSARAAMPVLAAPAASAAQ